ncbi:Heparan sulfate glucosamine 3-O-sulfotransferase 6 [Holothuria leucospilota]|uniref:Heparan sulfate glucosamine 3-O-sulfotransferase 6 n=1 Tax=Holothuria leucospilota TaxID=206669 RepID=A0A9Q1BUU9_HOLLE|nr:Heparan sulfate glucosamine 3-O-sulfotransferase 6 [Holothuria leucospilota]
MVLNDGTKGVIWTVLTIFPVLSIYLYDQDKEINKSVAKPIPRFSSNIYSRLTTEHHDENITPAQINLTEWSRDQMWGCYIPSSERKLLFGRNLRSHSTVDRLDCRKRVPDVALVGVKKCGSQTLAGFLDLHPKIVSVYEEEDRYNQCCVVRHRTKWIQYSPYSTPVQKTLVDVIKVADCVERVKWILEEIDLDMKFIVIIRDPYKRAVSDYKHLRTAERIRKNGVTKKNIAVIGENGKRHREQVNVYEGYNIPRTFEYAVLDSKSGNITDANLYISKGIYVNFMRQLIKYVPRQNLLVIDGEVFAKDPLSVVKSVERFLGVTSFFKREDFRKNSKGYFCPVIKERPDSGCLPFKAKGPTPKVSKSLQTKIKAFYRPYNRELENLLQQKFKSSS